MSHTPGPWTTDCGPQAIVEIAVVESGVFDAIEVYAGRAATSVDEHVGAARLIAAAPDLLAACKGALDFWSGNLQCAVNESDRECLNRCTRELGVTLKAALAKAEG